MAKEMTRPDERKPSLLKTALMMITNPAGALNRQLQEVNWKITAMIPAAAFGLLFLQTGFDLDEGGGLTLGLLFIGIIYGGGLVTLFGVGCSKVLINTEQNIENKEVIISAMHLAYTSMLVYQIFGVIMSMVLDWNTSVAFGVTGMLFALRPLMVTLRKLSSKQTVSIILTTVIGLILLAGWSLLGIIGG